MPDAVLIGKMIEIFVNILLISGQIEQELLQRRQIPLRIIDHDIHLTAITGRQNHRFRQPFIFIQIGQAALNCLLCDCEPLPHVYRCSLMIQPQHQ